MDQSCSSHYVYIACCLIIAVNIVYFIFTLIKLYIQYHRRQIARSNQQMIDQQSDTTVTKLPIKTGLERLAQLYPHVNEDTPLPSKWNSKDKPSSLVLQQNYLVVIYKGIGKLHKDAASVRADHPIPPLTGIYYYEVKILSKGRDRSIGIGLSTSEASLSHLPGWDKGSYGYHADDGHTFCSSSTGAPYGPTFTTNDYVGCCVNFLEKSCFYTRNGYNIGISCKDLPTEIYPTVGLQTSLESIEVNFGLSPFKFDIDKYMDEYREKIRRAIVECTLKENELLHQIKLRRIVSTYLVHYGYCATAEQFNKNAENVYADELNSMRNRQLIQNLILEGRTTDAIEKTKELFPTLFNNKNLLFVLKVRQFIEMINGSENEIFKPSISSQTANSSLLNKHHLHKFSRNDTTNRHSSKSNTASRSRSNSPYTPERNQTTNSEVQQYHTETINSSSRRLSANNNDLLQETETTMNSLSTSNIITDLMDIDDEVQGDSTINGFTDHEIMSYSNQVSNGHASFDDGDDSSNNLTIDNHNKTDAFSLLAYPDPKLSPLAHLLEPSQRECVSSVLNSAILEAHDMPRHPALEVLVGYLNECDKLMHKNNIPDCVFIELNKYLR